MKFINSSRWKRWKNKSNEEIFTEIYSEGSWGRSSSENSRYFSGGGSHGEDVVGPFVDCVQNALKTIDGSKKVVDLGCGDFNVGSRLVQYTDHYVGCDVVSDLIEYNKTKFILKNLTFQQLDITSDDLPDGDIVIIRQVLQHLTNQQISEVLDKVRLKYRYLILTEHLPNRKKFVANVDIPTGSLIRANINSGVIIEEPPFLFKFLTKKVLSEVPFSGGIVKTTLYKIH